MGKSESFDPLTSVPMPSAVAAEPTALNCSVRHLDLFICNFGEANELWMNANNGDGSFTLQSGIPLTSAVKNTKAAAWADYDGDGGALMSGRDLETRILNQAS